MINKQKQSLFTIKLLITLLLFSCNKSNLNNTGIGNLGDKQLHFQIIGIQELRPTALKSSTNSNHKKSVTSVKESQGEIIELGGIDAMLSISELNPNIQTKDSQDDIVKNKATNKNRSTMASTGNKLSKGVNYKIVIYKANHKDEATEYVNQADGIIGTTGVSIPAYRNTKYRWFAYTYNNAGRLSEFSPLKPNLQILPSGDHPTSRQDFAYATGIITTGDKIDGSSSINNIILQRVSSRIVLEINSRGMFGAVSHASPSFKSNSGLFKAQFNLIEGKLHSFSPDIGQYNVSNPHEMGYSVPVGVDSVTEVDWKRRYTFYTPAIGEAKPLHASIDRLWIKSNRLQEDGGTADINRLFSDRTFSFANFKAEAGKSYFISIKLVESAIQIGNTRWARGNVYRNLGGNLTPDNQWEYRFRYDNPVFNNASSVPHYTDFFTNDIYDINGRNVCQRVYPEGVWDLPMRDDFQELARHTNKQLNMENRKWHAIIIPNYLAAGDPGYPHGNLVFVPNGYKTRENSAIIDFHPGNILFFRMTKGYWRTAETRLFALFDNSVLFSRVEISTRRFSASRYANVRCVRR
ncbi:hypothetical protein M3B46_07895 [Sphingobacterium daejeonense]|uniref:hypothetical protein n=1 Tax=Sphingobacterium daejeonense TaxID=371142 RepID=UPI0021A53A4F|nr:hypothetical protein [Sphingobacterium daejeonense]MCT1530910.1 hypothetical protein [Sphingobacterium daejeonense]